MVAAVGGQVQDSRVIDEKPGREIDLEKLQIDRDLNVL
jgi:hypothetical protein